jgi:hypothetical protein
MLLKYKKKRTGPLLSLSHCNARTLIMEHILSLIYSFALCDPSYSLNDRVSNLFPINDGCHLFQRGAGCLDEEEVDDEELNE